MVRLHETRLIERPVDEVFAYTADFENVAEWDPGVASSTRIGEGPVGVGAKYDVVVSFGASQIPMTYEITEYEENERVVLVGRGEEIEAIDEIRFDDRGPGRTVVEYTADLTFHNYVKYLTPLMGPIFKRVGEKAVDGLAEALA